MKYIDFCPCCNSKNFADSSAAGFSPFVMDRMLGLAKSQDPKPHPAIIFICADCNFMGVNVRFTLEEERRYYQNYYQDSFTDHRTAYEGPEWIPYQKFYTSDGYKKLRRNTAAQILANRIDLTKIGSVLDYGGNTGELFPEQFNNIPRYLIEVESRTLSEGVIAINAPLEKPVDLIICSHTLEHVSFPNLLIEDLKKYAGPGTYIYVEVPTEEVSANFTVHEHLNFFSQRSLTKLLERNGFVDNFAFAIGYPKPMVESFAIVGRLA